MSVKSPASFAAGVLLPVLSLGLALSLCVNGILLATRGSVSAGKAPVAASSSPGTAAPDHMQPGGFGIVGQGFRMLAQKVDGMPSGVYRYQLPKGMLPDVPASMTLYRDQGITADVTPFETILSSMHVPLNIANLRLIPDDVTFVTADGKYSVLVNVRDRSVEVSLSQRTDDDASDVPVTPLPDDQIIAAARSMADELGIDTAAFGAPSIIKLYRVPDPKHSGQELAPGIEEVRWPLLFSGYPVVDQVGRPVSALSVFVGHRSKAGLAMNMHVLSPDVLSTSDYPTAARDVMIGLASEGGMAPVDGDEKGKTIGVTYQSATLAYMLPEFDPTRPTFVSPVIVLTADIPRACKSKPCVPWTWTTFVPALSPDMFAWTKGQMSSSASSGAASSVSSAMTSSAASSAPAPQASSSSAAAMPTSSSLPAAEDPNAGLQILR